MSGLLSRLSAMPGAVRCLLGVVLIALVAGILVGAAAGPARASPQQQGLPTIDPCEGCAFAFDRLTTVNCGEQGGGGPNRSEAILYRLTRFGQGPFKAVVCLLDFTGTPVACSPPDRQVVQPGEQNVIWELVAPVGVNVWKARAFICFGQGQVEIYDNFCLCDCGAPTADICDPNDCPSRYLPLVRFSADCVPGGWPSGTYWGQHDVKVMLTNQCLLPRPVHYWWRVVRDGSVARLGPYGVTIPPQSTIFLCESMGLFHQGDRIEEFVWMDRSCCSIQSATAASAGERCCPYGQPCTVYPPWDDGQDCIPPGLP